MSITVGDDVLDRIEEFPGAIRIQVQRASDLQAAAAGLRGACEEISRLPGGSPRFMTGVHQVRTGPFFYMDASDTRPRGLLTIPDVVTRHLVEAGVDSAHIAAPRGGDEWGMALHEVPKAVVLCLWPLPPRTWTNPETGFIRRAVIPEEWFDEVVAWVRRGLDDDAELGADSNSMQLYLPGGEALDHLKQGYVSRAPTCHLFAGQLDGRIRAVNGRFWDASLAVAGGGPAATDEDLMELFEELRGLARRLVGPRLAHAFVSIEPDFRSAMNSSHATERVLLGGVRPENMDKLWDVLLFDAFPYQILGPGHLGRLGGMPPGARAVDHGLVELSIGEPADWLLDPAAYTRPRSFSEPSERRRDQGVPGRARDLLAPCLVDIHTAWQLFNARYFPERAAGQP